MSDFHTLKEQARSLRGQKHYAEALPLYEQLAAEFPDQLTEWERWGRADCLRRLQRQPEALELCRALYRTHPNFTQNRNLYAWCVYDLEIKPVRNTPPADMATFHKAAEAITQLVKQEQYSPYERTVFAVLKALKTRQPYPGDEALAWCDRLDPDQLSTDEYKYTDADGVERTLASPLEQWFSHRTHALEALGRWEELIVVSREALDRLADFHYNDEIWFRRRIAIANGKLGNYAAAIADLKAIVREKPEWFIQFELARLLHDTGEDELALEQAVNAALGPGELHYKWDLFALMGDLFLGQEQPEQAAQHYQLAATLRAEQGWREDDVLAQRLKTLPPGGAGVARDQARALEGVWRALKFADQTRLTGEIERVDNGRRFGSIRDDGGRKHHFRFAAFVSPRERLMVGTKVSFFVQPSFDQKKQQDSSEAIDVREVTDY